MVYYPGSIPGCCFLFSTVKPGHLAKEVMVTPVRKLWVECLKESNNHEGKTKELLIDAANQLQNQSRLIERMKRRMNKIYHNK